MKKSENFRLDFMGIGAERSGTEWLYEALRDHPEICFSKIKEVNFFSDLDIHWPELKSPRYQRGWLWYERYFSHCQEGLKGEFSPTYLYSTKAAERIKKHFPKIKIIVSLRDPTKRTFSHYLHAQKLGLIGKISFEQALAENDVYIIRSSYYQPLKKYYSLFPASQIHVILLDEIRRNPKKTARDLYKFLGLKELDFAPPNLGQRVNVAIKPACSQLNQILIGFEYFFKRRGWDWPLRLIEESGLRQFGFWLGVKVNKKVIKEYPKMKKETEERLRKNFAKEINQLEKLIKKDLSSWKRNR